MQEWYYTRDNQQMGPVSWDELRQMASSGLLKPTDLIWKEGMVDWLKAAKKDGLYQRKSVSAALDEMTEKPRRRAAAADDDDVDDAPRRRRVEDEDDYVDDDRPRRRRRRAPQGMPLGAKVAIIGGSLAVGLVILVVVIILVVRGTGGTPGRFTVTLQPQQEHWRMVRLNGGQMVRITVSSNVIGNADVDLIVERPNGAPIAIDNRISKDCMVNFVVPQTDSYKLRVINLGPGRATCAVNFN